jgi:branched-chain amino acid transport system ATP-binding protein
VGHITAGGAVLSIDSLQVTYGGAVEAVRGVSMEVPDGSVVAVLGSNGAGKSTLLRTISGTLRLHRGRVDAGTVRVDDTDLTRRDPGQIVRQGVVQVPRAADLRPAHRRGEPARRRHGQPDRAAKAARTPGCTTCSPCSPSAAASGGAALRR